jgi:hypothetical protein
MTPRTMLITLAQGVAAVALAGALAQAVETAPGASTAYWRAGTATTPTPCHPWAEENLTPVPNSITYRFAPCAEVAHHATWAAIDATETAGIIDGSVYGLHYSNGAPLWTPTIYAYGTVPPEVLAGYPATLTAMPQETPVGWHLDGDRWVMDGGRQP